MKKNQNRFLNKLSYFSLVSLVSFISFSSWDAHALTPLAATHSIRVTLPENSQIASVNFIEYDQPTATDLEITNPLNTTLILSGKQSVCVYQGTCSFIDGKYQFTLVQNGDDLEIQFGAGPYLPHINFPGQAPELITLDYASNIVITAPGATFSIFNSANPSEVIPLDDDFSLTGPIAVSFTTPGGDIPPEDDGETPLPPADPDNSGDEDVFDMNSAGGCHLSTVTGVGSASFSSGFWMVLVLGLGLRRFSTRK